jgi:hypothetical protein
MKWRREEMGEKGGRKKGEKDDRIYSNLPI